MSRKICVVTGTRAEFGLLRWLMEAIKDHPKLTLQVVATGMHLSPEFGYTYREIEEAGINIDAKVEMLLSGETDTMITKSMGLGLIGFSEVYERLAPDLLVVLGDRYEILAATSAAMIARIPIAHLHGGEKTEGALDEAIRHSITKMSQLHFVAADEYRNRVIQLGENPSRVFNVGGMGVDAIKRVELLSRKELENSLDFRFGRRNLLITFHPVTLKSYESSVAQLTALVSALAELKNTHMIFTMPNSDPSCHKLIRIVEEFARNKPHVKFVKSLGQLRYLSCLALVDGVVGNSSSGILEAPTFSIGTVNIGNRQKGRLKSESIIDCEAEKESISEAIRFLYTKEFKKVLIKAQNPYGSGGAVEKILDKLANENLKGIIEKSFYDIPSN